MNGSILNNFITNNPNLKIVNISNKTSDTLLIQAVPEGTNIEDFYGGFFLVNKKNGEWRSCSPIDFL